MKLPRTKDTVWLLSFDTDGSPMIRQFVVRMVSTGFDMTPQVRIEPPGKPFYNGMLFITDLDFLFPTREECERAAILCRLHGTEKPPRSDND